MMKRIFLAILALAICFSTFAEARGGGHSGRHRSGGYGSHGKGSHYH
jgi:hypothetical protein